MVKINACHAFDASSILASSGVFTQNQKNELTSVLRCEDEKQKGTDKAGPAPYFVEKSTGCETYEKNVGRKNFVFSNARTSYFYGKLFFFNANKHQLYKKIC